MERNAAHLPDQALGNQTTNMKTRRVPLLRGISEVLLRTRWLLVVLTATMVIVVELEEHGVRPQNMTDFWRETILFGFVIPFTYGMLLSMLFYTRREKDDAERTMEQIAQLRDQLSHSQNLASVTSTIVNFPQSVLPTSGTSLRILNPDTGYYELVDFRFDAPVQNIEELTDLDRKACERCELRSTTPGAIQADCPVVTSSDPATELHPYCVPLAHKGEIIAILHVYFSEKPKISPRIARLLRDTAPEMARAIEAARLQQSAKSQVEAANMERKRIARDLHDTLGQNISYLRLKLDQITGEDALSEISAIRKELERMRDIADVAYLQVRNTLADLQPETQVPLAEAIRELLKQVSLRAGFEPVYEIRGKPMPMLSNDRRQMLFIFREAMNNIEKHAEASKVRVLLTWGADTLELEIHDDGHGFQVDDSSLVGHYGMKIMHERAREIGASLKVNSIAGEGTCVTLCLPLGQKSMAQYPAVDAASDRMLPN